MRDRFVRLSSEKGFCDSDAAAQHEHFSWSEKVADETADVFFSQRADSPEKFAAKRGLLLSGESCRIHSTHTLRLL